MDARTRALLTTLRAALIMAAKAIEKYLANESEILAICPDDSIVGMDTKS
jgi:hypothetical protein